MANSKIAVSAPPRNAVISGARLSAECVAIVSVTARSVQRISGLRATQQKD
jgi:hypothetical protein